MKFTLIPFLIGSIILTNACVAETTSNKAYGFFQNESGQWLPTSIERLQDHLVASKISCEPLRSEIDVVWNAESGDWAAYDKYSSDGPFFTRTIRFAQFKDTIEITKVRSDSKPEMRIGGDEVQQYDYLLEELKIWSQRDQFPYKVPQCAANIFYKR